MGQFILGPKKWASTDFIACKLNKGKGRRLMVKDKAIRIYKTQSVP
jgi:hypothetical protein